MWKVYDNNDDENDNDKDDDNGRGKKFDQKRWAKNEIELFNKDESI